MAKSNGTRRFFGAELAPKGMSCSLTARRNRLEKLLR